MNLEYELSRAIEKIDFAENDGCWLWLGSRRSGGYAQFYPHGQHAPYRSVMVHRWLYEIVNGLIPDTMTIDHLCRVRHCVNPDHLEIVTMRENTLRGIGPTAVNAKKTHCVNGHELNDANVYLNPRKTWTSRLCRSCMRAASRRWKRKMASIQIREMK